MRLWRAVILLNLAVGVGLLLGWLAWGQQIPRLEQRLRDAQQRVLLVGVERTWVVSGVVRAIIPETQLIVVTHEEIPGYMSAGMTMGFKAASPKVLEQARVGDVVKFTLKGVPPDVEITAIEREGKS
jgi:Cu/Ag efflux protein CusF